MRRRRKFVDSLIYWGVMSLFVLVLLALIIGPALVKLHFLVKYW